MTTVSNLAPFLLPFVVSLAPNVVSSTSTSTVSGRFLGDTGVIPLQGWEDVGAGWEGTSRSMTEVASVTDRATVLTMLPASAHLAPWLSSAIAKLSDYRDVRDGWKGDGSVAPAAATLEQAAELLTQFATEMPEISQPMISADDDGSVCLFWRDGQMMATVSAHGDGTYSFYAEGYDDAARSDSEEVGMPLPSSLITTMTGVVVAGLIAA